MQCITEHKNDIMIYIYNIFSSLLTPFIILYNYNMRSFISYIDC